MRNAICVALLLAVAVACPGLIGDAESAPLRKPRGVEQDVPRLEGVWKQVYVEFEGNEQAHEYATNNHWVITADKITIMTGGPQGQDRGSWVYKINAAAMPVEIDLTANPQATYPSIIQLDGDKLTLCLQNFPERGRPKDFTSRPGSGVGKFIYQRVPAR